MKHMLERIFGPRPLSSRAERGWYKKKTPIYGQNADVLESANYKKTSVVSSLYLTAVEEEKEEKAKEKEKGNFALCDGFLVSHNPVV